MPRLVAFVLFAACVLAATPAPLEIWAFTAPWDRASDEAVRAHGGELDAVVSAWIALDSTTARPFQPFPHADTVRPREGTPARMALVTSWHGDRFHAETIRRLARERPLLASVAGEIARISATAGHRGIILDFETLERRDLDALLRVAGAIGDSARARGVAPIVLAIPAEDTAAYPARRLLDAADLLFVMLYDQHWLGSQPGPISAPGWVERALALRLSEVGPESLVAGLPTYGYRWRRGAETEIVGFAAADSIARAERAPLERDAATSTLRAARGAWEMWVTDAELLRRLVAHVREAGVHRIALWRMGQEDPRIWSAGLRAEPQD